MKLRLKLELFNSDNAIAGELSFLTFTVPFEVSTDEKGVRFNSETLSFYFGPKRRKINLLKLTGSIKLKMIYLIFSSKNEDHYLKRHDSITATIMKIDLIHNKISLMRQDAYNKSDSGYPLMPENLRLFCEAEISLSGIISAM